MMPTNILLMASSAPGYSLYLGDTFINAASVRYATWFGFLYFHRACQHTLESLCCQEDEFY